MTISLDDIDYKKERLNTIYKIIDKNGHNIQFLLNDVQEDVLDNLHNRNIILKARQLGMSTFCVLYMLDECAWNDNISAGIVSYSLEHSQHIFKRIIGHALDNLPKWLNVPIVSRSAREITFKNGSVLRVDTTLRGGSYQLVLVSEFGKTCARNPQKAEEVVTGTLQTVHADGKIIIESTAEGSDGYFSEIVQESSRRGNNNLNALEYKLFFYPWYKEKSYSLIENMHYDITTIDYFHKIEKDLDIILTKEQKNWYAVQEKLLGDKIKQEFPSTIQESFLSTSEAYYFAESIADAYKDSRCVYNNISDSIMPVYVAMDLGINDLTVMIFFQICHGEIRVIDYYEDKNKDVEFYSRFLLHDKKYLYNTIFLPHDSVKRSPLDVSNTCERDFRRLFSHTGTKFTVLPRMDKQALIAQAKLKFKRCVFNLQKVKPLLDNMSKYRKRWNEALSRYMEEPLHNEASNHADAFQYLSQAVSHLEASAGVSNSQAYQKHIRAVENRSKNIL